MYLGTLADFNQPVTEGTVRILRASDGTEIGSTTVDASGRFRQQVQPGTYRFEITTPGYRTRTTQPYTFGTADVLNLADILIEDGVAMEILEQMTWRGQSNSKRWTNNNLKVVYNTNTDQANGNPIYEAEVEAHIRDIWENDIKPATVSHLYTDGFFANTPVEKVNRELLNTR